jgi:integrase
VCLKQQDGCRPDEVCGLRPIDLDMSNPACWVYRPGSDQGEHGQHKTAHHGHDRLILIGPKAQEILRPHLSTKLDAYCFSPVEAERLRSPDRRTNRKSPMTPSQQARRARTNRKRQPQDRYAVTSYRNAIYRVCDRAFLLPEQLAPNGQRRGNGKAARRGGRGSRNKSGRRCGRGGGNTAGTPTGSDIVGRRNCGDMGSTW